MTKGYVCWRCGSQVVGHSEEDCDNGSDLLFFETWWEETGKFIDPDTEDVSWFDKRKELSGFAFIAGCRQVRKPDGK